MFMGGFFLFCSDIFSGRNSVMLASYLLKPAAIGQTWAVTAQNEPEKK
jgi:hypothetical protein